MESEVRTNTDQLQLLLVHPARGGDQYQLEPAKGFPYVETNIMAGRATADPVADSRRSIFRTLLEQRLLCKLVKKRTVPRPELLGGRRTENFVPPSAWVARTSKFAPRG